MLQQQNKQKIRNYLKLSNEEILFELNTRFLLGQEKPIDKYIVNTSMS